MMGREGAAQGKLFYTGIQLDRRIRKNHPLRKILEVVDFDFVYREVGDKYGTNGNVSVPPPVILKLMLLLVFYNVRSERELLETLPERLDWLWFLGYDLDQEAPDHSVLSKARRRWGVEVFRGFFERVVLQCVEAGLVDGAKIFVDSSLVEADASKESLVDVRDLKEQLSEKYRQLEARLAEEPSVRQAGPEASVNDRLISATDPDAAVVRRGDSKLRYQVHRAVDEQTGIITATATTAGDVNEAHKLNDLIACHEAVTGAQLNTVVADSKYGTVENYLACSDQGIRAHIPSLSRGTDKRLAKRGLFAEDRFQYDRARDVYICPAGQELRPRTFHKRRQMMEYMARKSVCAVCTLREQCTRNKTARTIGRYLRQEEIDRMRAAATSAAARRDLRRRQHVCEGSFGQATRYGYKRARWRRLWRVEIQNYLTCTIQNIVQLMKGSWRRATADALALGAPRPCPEPTKISPRRVSPTISHRIAPPLAWVTPDWPIATWAPLFV